MREIKFRAWDKDKKEMFIPLTIDWLPGKCPPGNPVQIWRQRSQVSDDGEWIENFEVMQFIGLKDINEKEIYEGDIVKFKLGRRFYKYIIAWDNLNACFFGLQVPCKIYTGGNKEKEFFRKIEVIGNIYENSELNKQGGKK